jgi:hypothetical protein
LYRPPEGETWAPMSIGGIMHGAAGAGERA